MELYQKVDSFQNIQGPGERANEGDRECFSSRGESAVGCLYSISADLRISGYPPQKDRNQAVCICGLCRDDHGWGTRSVRKCRGAGMSGWIITGDHALAAGVFVRGSGRLRRRNLLSGPGGFAMEPDDLDFVDVCADAGSCLRSLPHAFPPCRAEDPHALSGLYGCGLGGNADSLSVGNQLVRISCLIAEYAAVGAGTEKNAEIYRRK